MRGEQDRVHGRPKLSDVAAAAGVAPATVSRALNEPAKLAPATLARVLQAVEALGYVPDLTAGSLASARSRIVGAVVPTLANAWFAEAMEGLAATLAPQGYQLLLAQSQYHPQSEPGLVDAFLGRRVDAIVLTGRSHPKAMRDALRARAIPVVEIWDLPRQPIDMAVGFSHVALGAAAGEHLRARGHARVGFIGADEERSRLRRQGFCEGMGQPEIPSLYVPPPSSIEAGEGAARALREAHPELTAIFCSNDLLAMGALVHARTVGLRVPQQLAVVGFSDLPVSRVFTPAITTMRIEAMEIGRCAGEMLLDRLAGRAPARGRVVDLGFRLVERETS